MRGILNDRQPMAGADLHDGIEVAWMPATHAAHVASSAAAGCVRRWPNSITLFPFAAMTTRAAFDATIDM